MIPAAHVQGTTYEPEGSLMSLELTTDGIADADTVVLIHGLWMTPRSWEHWIHRYERNGYRVLAPAYPGFEVEVEALREDPSPIDAVTVPGTVTASIGEGSSRSASTSTSKPG